MTTARSPLRQLQKQADKAAKQLKSIAEGGPPGIPDPLGKIAAALKRESITFAVVMDDKIINITMAWALIREHSQASLSQFILKQMREQRDNA